jgi:N6-adenosine-specific RNA methylase IME4/ParB-like chromosome segregation protein Spo0J
MPLTKHPQFHPLADLIPSMTDEEYRGLVEDIRANGLIEPIFLYEGKILDGRHRYRACLELGIEPRFEEYQDNNPVSFVVSKNLKRRHLTESQKAVLAVELLPYIEKEARERQIKSGSLGGRGIKKGSEKYNEKVSQLQEQTIENNEKENLEQKIAQGFSQGRASEIVARLVDTNREYVKAAKRLSLQAPEVLEVVKEGKVNIMQAKKIANLPEELRETVIEKIKGNGDNGHKVERIIAEVRNHILSDRTCALPDDLFDVILADPPWQYDFSLTVNREIENHYPTMTLEEIKAVKVPAARDAVLFLWVTAPKLVEGLEVMSEWGFEYRTCAAWDKEVIGMGYWFRNQHELLLVGTRGNPFVPTPENRFPSVIRARREEHSRKPDIIYEMIEKMLPGCKYLELFARQQRTGWTAWGNECDLPAY